MGRDEGMGDRVIGGAVVACVCGSAGCGGARSSSGEGGWCVTAHVREMRRRFVRWCLRAGPAGVDELCRT